MVSKHLSSLCFLGLFKAAPASADFSYWQTIRKNCYWFEFGFVGLSSSERNACKTM